MPHSEHLRAAWLAILFSASASHSATATSSAELVQKGAKHQLLGEDEQAVKCFSEAIRINPGNAEAYSLRGDSRLQYALGMSVSCSEDYTKALELNPKDYHSALFRAYTVMPANHTRGMQDLVHGIEILKTTPQNQSWIKHRTLASLWSTPKNSTSDAARWAQLYPQDAEAFFTLALCLESSNRLPEANTAFKRAIEMAKKDAETHMDANTFRILGRSYVGLKQARQGIDWLTGYLERHPKAVYAYRWRGYLLSWDGQEAKAIKDFEKLLELSPNNVGVLVQLANTHKAAGQLREAAKYYQRAMPLSPDDDMTLIVKRATCLKELGMRKLAIAEITGAITRQPQSYKLYGMLSDLERPLDPEKSQRDLEKAIELVSNKIFARPQSVELLVERMELYEQAHKPRKVIKDLEEALKLKPNDPALYHKRAGLKWSNLNQREDALADETMAIENAAVPAGKIGYILARGGYYLSLGQFQKAIDDANRCLALDPTYGHAFRLRANVNSALGNHEAAISDLKQSAQNRKSAPRDVDSLLGRAYAAMNKNKEALAAFNKSLARDPRHIESLVARANLYNRVGKHEAAIKDLNLAIEIMPTSSEAHYNRAKSYEAIGEYDRAISDLTETMNLRREPNAPWLLEDRAHLLTFAERYQQAANDLIRAYRYDRSKPARIFDAGKLLYHAGDKRAAIEAISAYLEAVPQDHLATRARARCYFETDQLDRSIADYSSLISDNPESAVLYKLRAKSYDKLGKSDLANTDRMKASQLTKSANTEPTRTR